MKFCVRQLRQAENRYMIAYSYLVISVTAHDISNENIPDIIPNGALKSKLQEEISNDAFTKLPMI